MPTRRLIHVAPHGGESERIWIAPAKRGGEDIGRLAALVEEAKMDMNYVLLWAEQGSQ
jgi:hypothetical protein